MTELLPAAEAPAGFPFEAKHVRLRLGLSREESRLLRKAALRPGDWTRHKKRVYLSQAGLARLQDALAQKTAAARPGAMGRDGGGEKNDFTKNPAPQTEPERQVQPQAPEAPGAEQEQAVMLRVVRADLANRRMLLACAATEDPGRPARTVRVRVRSAANFKRGMELPAVLVPGYRDLYDLARNLPRQKGKW